MQRLLARTGQRAANFDVIESNEACAVSRALDLYPAEVNVNGGAITLGHPLGSSPTAPSGTAAC